MNANSTIVITGSAGFIGSCLTGFLNEKGYHRLVLVDDFTRADRAGNLKSKSYLAKVDRGEFFDWLSENEVDFIFHLGARTNTAEFDYEVHRRLNLEYSKAIWRYCSRKQVPLIYASSAATYGDGGAGYDDDHTLVNKLEPLNPYGLSKHAFDQWVLQHPVAPPYWAGLKFFNVYGPNEYHKGRMASMVWHTFQQVKTHGYVKLFRSHRPDYEDGQQLRDFIYVADLVNVCYWLMQNPASGGHIYNLGTGQARSFEDLAKAVFKGLEQPTAIVYVDMPEDIRSKYQYFTQANMAKLRNAGYPYPFLCLEEGILDYLQHYLLSHNYY
jgi:ADP-L-glycero-D-manno-heptose 6-epimerase